MKSFLLVMLLVSFLPLACEGQSVDREVTVVGRDETIMAVPDPPAPEQDELPAPDLWLPETPLSPVVLPGQTGGPSGRDAAVEGQAPKEAAPEGQVGRDAVPEGQAGTEAPREKQPVQDPAPAEVPAG